MIMEFKWNMKKKEVKLERVKWWWDLIEWLESGIK